MSDVMLKINTIFHDTRWEKPEDYVSFENDEGGEVVGEWKQREDLTWIFVENRE